jgi:hypothetical protein
MDSRKATAPKKSQASPAPQLAPFNAITFTLTSAGDKQIGNRLKEKSAMR